MRKVKYVLQTSEDGRFKYENKEGFFHEIQVFGAIIEDLDGCIDIVPIQRVQFLDNPDDAMWEQRRYEIARGVIINRNAPEAYAIEYAIEMADRLIEVLKREEK